MYFTYVLLCTDTARKRVGFYTGSSENIPDRLGGHLFKSVKTTKSFDRIELVYYEACLNKTDALVREKQLKTGFGRGYVKRRLKNWIRENAGFVHR